MEPILFCTVGFNTNTGVVFLLDETYPQGTNEFPDTKDEVRIVMTRLIGDYLSYSSNCNEASSLSRTKGLMFCSNNVFPRIGGLDDADLLWTHKPTVAGSNPAEPTIGYQLLINN